MHFIALIAYNTKIEVSSFHFLSHFTKSSWCYAKQEIESLHITFSPLFHFHFVSEYFTCSFRHFVSWTDLTKSG
jgi:hypothetical protein